MSCQRWASDKPTKRGPTGGSHYEVTPGPLHLCHLQDGFFPLESVLCHFGVWNECGVSERALTGHHAPSRHSLLPRMFDPHAGMSIKTLNGLSGCTWTVHFKKIPLHWLNVILCFLRMHNDINDPQEKSTDMDSCNQLCCFHDYS